MPNLTHHLHRLPARRPLQRTNRFFTKYKFDTVTYFHIHGEMELKIKCHMFRLTSPQDDFQRINVKSQRSKSALKSAFIVVFFKSSYSSVSQMRLIRLKTLILKSLVSPDLKLPLQ